MEEITVVVGSKNPVKVKAVQEAFEALLSDTLVQCIGVNAPSNVADQPMTDDETRIGAENRVAFCSQHHQADYYVAMEGGVDCLSYGPATFAYVVIADHNTQSVGRSAELPIPLSVYEALQQGQELGDVMDDLFNTKNIKQKGGAIGLLTNGVESRQSNYRQALILAMAPFLHGALFS